MLKALIFGMARIGAILTCIFVNFACIKSHIGFTVTEWTKCPKSKGEFRTFVGFSVKQCVDECTTRTSCKSIGWRGRNVCEIYFEDMATEDNNGQPCIYIHKDDMSNIETLANCNCEGGYVCESSTGQCRKECKPLTATNGRVYGNKRHFGSKVAFQCNTGYSEKNTKKAAYCRADGEWSYYPSCVAADELQTTKTPQGAETTKSSTDVVITPQLTQGATETTKPSTDVVITTTDTQSSTETSKSPTDVVITPQLTPGATETTNSSTDVLQTTTSIKGAEETTTSSTDVLLTTKDAQAATETTNVLHTTSTATTITTTATGTSKVTQGVEKTASPTAQTTTTETQAQTTTTPANAAHTSKVTQSPAKTEAQEVTTRAPSLTQRNLFVQKTETTTETQAQTTTTPANAAHTG